MIHHSFQYFIVRAINGVLAFATLAIFTRILSPHEYGVYALGMAIASVTSGIMFQWINAAIGRFYSIYLDDPQKVMDVTAYGFWVATSVVGLLALGAFTFREVIGADPVMVGILFLITVALGFHTMALQVVNVQSAPIRYGILSWAKSGGALSAGFVFIYYGYGGKGALLGFLAGLMIAVVAFAPKEMMQMKIGIINTPLAANMFRFGLPLTVNHIAIATVDLADRFIISSIVGVAHVAPYAVAYDLVQQTVGPIMNVLFLAAFPVIVRVFDTTNDDEVRIHLLSLGSRLVTFGLPVAVGLGILSSDISEILFGNGYRQDAAAIMPWLAAAIFMGAFKSYFLDLVFQLAHKTNYQVYIAMLMATINIVLNLILLPRYGVIAAAWSTLVAFCVGALVSWLVGRTVVSLPDLKSVFLGSTLAAVIMALVMYSLPSSLGLGMLSAKIAIGLFTYALMASVLDFGDSRKLMLVFIRRLIR